MSKGTAIYNPDVQSDIDMKNTWKLLNYPGSGNAILSVENTIYVDGLNGTSGGQRGTSSAFQSLAQALSVAQAGDIIQLRPGIYTQSVAQSISVNNLTLIGEGATIKANSETLGNILTITGSNTVIRGIIFDGGRSSNTSIQNWGTVQVSGTGCKIRQCTFQHSIGRLINASANLDGLEISDCELFDFYQAIAFTNLTGSNTSVQRFEIRNNKIHDTWASSAFPGGIKLSTGTPIMKGLVINNQVWGGTNTGNEAGIELQGNYQRCVVSGNRIYHWAFGISLDSASQCQVDCNNIQQGAFCGIEFVGASQDNSATGNHLDGLSDDGTTIATGSGYSISTNIGVGTPSKIAIVGGTVSNYSLNGVHADRTSGITVSNLYVDMPPSAGAPFSFQHLGDSNTPAQITVENCWVNIVSTTSYGIFCELTTGGVNSAMWYFRNNTFNYTATPGSNHYALYHFFSGDSTGTFNDVIISGTRTNGGFWGSGVVDSNGPAVSYLSFNNSPQNTNIQSGFNDTVTTTAGIQSTGADFALNDAGIPNTSAVRVLSDSGNLYFNYGTGGHIYFRNAAGTVLGTVSSTGLDFNGLSVATHAVEQQNNKGVASGYASLDGSGKVPAGQLPTLSSGTIATTAANLKGDNAGNAVPVTATGTGDTVLATSPTLITPTIGVATATSVNKWTLTAPSTAATLTAGADNLTYTMPEITTKIGFRHIPQNSKSTAYTTVLNDSGYHIYHPASDANARTFTIDSNANVAYPIGTAINFVNMSANSVTIAITSDTMYLAGAGTTGSRTLAQYGKASALKTGTTEWVISGTGLT